MRRAFGGPFLRGIGDIFGHCGARQDLLETRVEPSDVIAIQARLRATKALWFSPKLNGKNPGKKGNRTRDADGKERVRKEPLAQQRTDPSLYWQ